MLSLSNNSYAHEDSVDAVHDSAIALEQHGAYYAAYTELVRQIPQYSGAEKKGLIMEAGEVLWRHDQFDAAREHFQLYRSDPEYSLVHAYSVYRSSNRGDCTDFSESETQPMVQYVKAWCLLEQERANDAVNQILLMPPSAVAVVPGVELVNLISTNKELGYRSPMAAGVLSAALPGLGQIYTKKSPDALSALVVVGLFGAATAYSVKEKNWGSATTFGFLTTAFYSGNILSAVNGAKVFNKREYQKFLGVLGSLRPVIKVEKDVVVVTQPN